MIFLFHKDEYIIRKKMAAASGYPERAHCNAEECQYQKIKYKVWRIGSMIFLFHKDEYIIRKKIAPEGGTNEKNDKGI